MSSDILSVFLCLLDEGAWHFLVFLRSFIGIYVTYMYLSTILTQSNKWCCFTASALLNQAKFSFGKKKIAFQMSLKRAWLHIRVIIRRNDRSVFVKNHNYSWYVKRTQKQRKYCWITSRRYNVYYIYLLSNLHLRNAVGGAFPQIIGSVDLE